jgi:hypothetical protein
MHAGWHPELARVKRYTERSLFKLSRGYRLKDLAERLVANPIARPLVVPAIRDYVLGPLKRRKLIFIHVPKNAGTAISQAIYGRGLAHYRAWFYRRLDPAFYEATPSFAILRDPIDRFISAYFFVKNSGGDMIELYPPWSQIYAKLATLDMDLFLAVHQVFLRHYRRLDYVLRPQCDFIFDENNKVMVDHLFVMGRDDEALRTFLMDHGVGEVPRLNTTARSKMILTYEQRATIYNLYRQDTDLFNANVRGY